MEWNDVTSFCITLVLRAMSSLSNHISPTLHGFDLLLTGTFVLKVSKVFQEIISFQLLSNVNFLSTDFRQYTVIL